MQQCRTGLYVHCIDIRSTCNSLNRSQVKGRNPSASMANGAESAERGLQSYDLCVIGGGSGGMAAAKEASKLGKQVLLLEYGAPSPGGTLYGPSAFGCCVTAGCVPKLLCHFAACTGESIVHDASPCGFGSAACTSDGVSFDWATLIKNVHSIIKKLRFEYRKSLSSARVQHITARGWLDGPEKVSFSRHKDGSVGTVHANNVVIAVGGRPDVPNIIGSELGITSDDLFWLQQSPGTTLVVGGSYVALECAGFLNGTMHNVTVAVRSTALRGFDRECADKVVKLEREAGVKFHFGVQPERIDKSTSTSRKAVTFSDGSVEHFDTVLFATGRTAATSSMQLERAGVRLGRKGKVVGDINGNTDAPNVFAVGDVLENNFELTPVAIKQGELLARRMFSTQAEAADAYMSHEFVPTTIFTPIEYGSVGLSEEDAYHKYGSEDVEVYLSEFASLESMLAQRKRASHTISEEEEEMMDVERSPECLVKIICLISQQERVVGLHFVGPKAGEVVQLGAVALRKSATKKDLDETIAIHPTCAEAFTGLSVTRRSGQTYASAGCGGGRCG